MRSRARAGSARWGIWAALALGTLSPSPGAEAGEEAGGTYTPATAAYTLPLPAGWKAAPVASATGVETLAFGAEAGATPKDAAEGLWVHLVPIPTDEQLDDIRWRTEYAAMLLRTVHPDATLDPATAQAAPLSGTPGTRWTIAAGVGGGARRGEFRLLLRRDLLLGVEASAPAAAWDRARESLLRVVDSLRWASPPPVTATPPAEPQRASAVAARYRGSVPNVFAHARSDADGNLAGVPQPVDTLGELFSGTGFVVTADGYVVTNRHVVAHEQKDGRTRFTYDPVVLRWDPLLGRQDDVADVVAVGRQWDLALLKLRGAGPWTPMPLSDIDAVSDAQQVLVMGWPSVDPDAPLLLHHNWNVIAGIERDAKLRPRIIRHGARTTAGNSGGPVYGLETGGVVGVHTRGYISTAHEFQDMFQHGAVPVDRVIWEFPQVFAPEAPGTTQEARLARAAFFFRQDRFGAAMLECNRILAADPNEGRAHAYLYRILRLQGEPQFAQEHFAPAVAQDRSRVLVHLFAARSALEEGDVTALGREAALAASTALALGEKNPETTLLLGHALSNASLFEAAFEESGKASAEARTMQGMARLRSWLSRSAVVSLSGAPPLSDEDLQAIGGPLTEGLRLWPLHTPAYVYLALLYALRGQQDPVGPLVASARALGDYDPETLTALAYLDLLRDDPAQATIDAWNAFGIRPTAPASYLLGVAEVRLAHLLETLGKDDRRRITVVNVLDGLGLTTDAARLRNAGAGRIDRARQSVRNRMATQLDKQALLGWWDFAILTPLER